MFIHCNAPGCMMIATKRCRFLDPRRGSDDDLKYVVKYFCSEEHQLAIVDELEKVAHYARLVS